MTVTAITYWRTNAEMILDLVKLGYLKSSDKVLDPTFGEGKWWTLWRPDDLTARDRKLDNKFDFRDTEFDDNSFDAITFDPPYVCAGGRKTSTLGIAPDGESSDFHWRYGMHTAPTTPQGVQQQINDGLIECDRLVKPGGYVLVKCTNYIISGKYWPGVFKTIHFAFQVGYELVDELYHLSSPRPQPKNRTRKDGTPVRQQHSRNNYSTLLVLKKPKKKKAVPGQY